MDASKRFLDISSQVAGCTNASHVPHVPRKDKRALYALSTVWRIIGNSYSPESLQLFVDKTERKWRAKKVEDWETGFVVLTSRKKFSLRFGDGRYFEVCFRREDNALHVYFAGSKKPVNSKGPYLIAKDYADDALKDCPLTQPPRQLTLAAAHANP